MELGSHSRTKSGTNLHAVFCFLFPSYYVYTRGWNAIADPP